MGKHQEPRLFTVVRRQDTGRVSGTGRVMDGVIFHNGWVAVCWRTDVDAAAHGHASMSFYPSFESFRFIHIESHPDNKTEIIFQTPKSDA